MRPGLALLLCCCAAFAQTLDRSRIATGLEAIRAADMHANLDFLASPALEGRLSLTRGSEIAIHWIESEFQKAGLKQLVPGSWLQPVPLIEYRADRAASGLTISRNGKKDRYSFPEAYGTFFNDVDVSGRVVFAGYGISAPELNYDDYAGIDVKGKIVLIFDHEPQETDARSPFNGKGNTRYAGTFVKTLTAQKRGALAVLIVAEPNRKHPSNQERVARIRGQNERARMPSQALAESELQIPAFTVSDKIADDLLGGQAKQLQASIDGDLKPVSRDLDASARLNVVVTERRRATTYNVVGMIEGSDPTLKAETVIYSAHYDHDGFAVSGGVFHGADDNGSGTVGVVALAHAYGKNPVKPKRTMVFAVFAAEERGLLGSYYYAAHPLRPLDKTRAVINFDMIGRNETASEQTNGLIEIATDTSNELNLVGANYSPRYRAMVEEANRSVGLNLNYKWDEEPALNVYFRSDHYPFALRGIPAMWWFTGFHPDYHQVSDTSDKINYGKMEKIVRLAYVTGFEFGETNDPPGFKP